MDPPELAVASAAGAEGGVGPPADACAVAPAPVLVEVVEADWPGLDDWSSPWLRDSAPDMEGVEGVDDEAGVVVVDVDCHVVELEQEQRVRLHSSPDRTRMRLVAAGARAAAAVVVGQVWQIWLVEGQIRRPNWL